MWADLEWNIKFIHYLTSNVNVWPMIMGLMINSQMTRHHTVPNINNDEMRLNFIDYIMESYRYVPFFFV